MAQALTVAQQIQAVQQAQAAQASFAASSSSSGSSGSSPSGPVVIGTVPSTGQKIYASAQSEQAFQEQLKPVQDRGGFYSINPQTGMLEPTKKQEPYVGIQIEPGTKTGFVSTATLPFLAQLQQEHGVTRATYEPLTKVQIQEEGIASDRRYLSQILGLPEGSITNSMIASLGKYSYQKRVNESFIEAKTGKNTDITFLSDFEAAPSGIISIPAGYGTPTPMTDSNVSSGGSMFDTEITSPFDVRTKLSEQFQQPLEAGQAYARGFAYFASPKTESNQLSFPNKNIFVSRDTTQPSKPFESLYEETKTRTKEAVAPWSIITEPISAAGSFAETYPFYTGIMKTEFGGWLKDAVSGTLQSPKYYQQEVIPSVAGYGLAGFIATYKLQSGSESLATKAGLITNFASFTSKSATNPEVLLPVALTALSVVAPEGAGIFPLIARNIPIAIFAGSVLVKPKETFKSVGVPLAIGGGIALFSKPPTASIQYEALGRQTKEGTIGTVSGTISAKGIFTYREGAFSGSFASKSFEAQFGEAPFTKSSSIGTMITKGQTTPTPYAIDATSFEPLTVRTSASPKGIIPGGQESSLSIYSSIIGKNEFIGTTRSSNLFQTVSPAERMSVSQDASGIWSITKAKPSELTSFEEAISTYGDRTGNIGIIKSSGISKIRGGYLSPKAPFEKINIPSPPSSKSFTILRTGQPSLIQQELAITTQRLNFQSLGASLSKQIASSETSLIMKSALSSSIGATTTKTIPRAKTESQIAKQISMSIPLYSNVSKQVSLMAPTQRQQINMGSRLEVIPNMSPLLQIGTLSGFKEITQEGVRLKELSAQDSISRASYGIGIKEISIAKEKTLQPQLEITLEKTIQRELTKTSTRSGQFPPPRTPFPKIPNITTLQFPINLKMSGISRSIFKGIKPSKDTRTRMPSIYAEIVGLKSRAPKASDMMGIAARAMIVGGKKRRKR